MVCWGDCSSSCVCEDVFVRHYFVCAHAHGYTCMKRNINILVYFLGNLVSVCVGQYSVCVCGLLCWLTFSVTKFNFYLYTYIYMYMYVYSMRIWRCLLAVNLLYVHRPQTSDRNLVGTLLSKSHVLHRLPFSTPAHCGFSTVWWWMCWGWDVCICGCV